MSTISTTLLATDLNAIIQQVVQQAVAGLPSQPVGPPVTGGSSVSSAPIALNIRDYGAKQDATTDDTAAIIRAMADAAKPGYPSTVFVPGCGITLSGPLSIPAPGVQLAGEGMMGVGAATTKVSILRARNEPSDSGPFLTVDPVAMGPGIQWVRGSSGVGGHISFDVSMCQRFSNNPELTAVNPPPPVIAFYSLSNVPEIGDVCVFGNEGTAFLHAPTPTIPSAIPEGIYLKNCYAYGGYGPTGLPTGRPPLAAALVFAGANQVQVIGGKYVYLNQPVPTNTMADIPGILIIGVSIGDFVNPGSNILIESPSVTNYAVDVQIQGVDNGAYHFCPSFVTVCGMMWEQTHVGLKINMEPTTMQVSTYRSYGIRCYGNCATLPYPWQDGPVAASAVAQVIMDKAFGGYIDVEYLRTDKGSDMTFGDVRLGPNTAGVQGRIGAQPNGQSFNVTDLGVGNKLMPA